MAHFDVYISAKAQADIAECVSFVLRLSPDAAHSVTDTLYSVIMSLDEFPERNPVFEMPKTYPYVLRKCVINGRYLALYRLDGQRVIVLRVLDARRKFDSLLG